MEKIIGGIIAGVGLGVVAVVVVLALAAIGAFPFMWCWNYVIPVLFGLPKITALQAFCLSWVAGSIFKSSSYSPSK